MTEMPTGVKVISILYQIGGVIDMLLGTFLTVVGTGLTSLIAGNNALAGLIGAVSGVVFLIGGLFLVGIGVLIFVVGRGLWNARNWARIVVIVLSVVGILMSFANMFTGFIMGIITLAVNGLICWYMTTNKDVKKTFA